MLLCPAAIHPKVGSPAPPFGGFGESTLPQPALHVHNKMGVMVSREKLLESDKCVHLFTFLKRHSCDARRSASVPSTAGRTASPGEHFRRL
jgi:hypothetical protein